VEQPTLEMKNVTDELIVPTIVRILSLYVVTVIENHQVNNVMSEQELNEMVQVLLMTHYTQHLLEDETIQHMVDDVKTIVRHSTVVI
jgi:predicted nucleic acid-binding protein